MMNGFAHRSKRVLALPLISTLVLLSCLAVISQTASDQPAASAVTQPAEWPKDLAAWRTQREKRFPLPMDGFR